MKNPFYIRKIEKLDAYIEQVVLGMYKELQSEEHKFNPDRVLDEEFIQNQVRKLKTDYFNKDSFELFIGFEENEPVGLMEVEDDENFEAGYKYIYIHSLVVLSQHRGKGYGREFIRLAREIARSKGYRHVGLDVLPNNLPAKSLYLSEGFDEYAIEMMALID